MIAPLNTPLLAAGIFNSQLEKVGIKVAGVVHQETLCRVVLAWPLMAWPTMSSTAELVAFVC